MNWLVYHIASGQSFFTGVTLLIIAALASTSSRAIWNRVTVLAFLVGVIGVLVSSTPLPYWLYTSAAVVTLVWLVSRYKKPWRRWAPYATIVTWVFATCVELPYHTLPTLNVAGDRKVTILGDSVTAGIGGGETSETWPSILAREHGLQVQDISHEGETAASALKRASSHPIIGSILIVEIGGNDILGRTTAAQFARDLDALLAFVAAGDRQIVMFELPLPPCFHEYGRVQRTLAARYNISLVPKRVFLSVIAGDGSTLDTIHLTQLGHQSMADCAWRLIRSAFEGGNVASSLPRSHWSKLSIRNVALSDWMKNSSGGLGAAKMGRRG